MSRSAVRVHPAYPRRATSATQSFSWVRSTAQESLCPQGFLHIPLLAVDEACHDEPSRQAPAAPPARAPGQ